MKEKNKDFIDNYIDGMKKFTKKILKSKKKSREFLMNIGIYTKRGNLKRIYNDKIN